MKKKLIRIDAVLQDTLMTDEEKTAHIRTILDER